MENGFELLKGYFRKYQLDLTIIILAIILAFIVSGIFIAFFGANPFLAFYSMGKGVFGRVNGIAEMMVKATPLLIIALGVAIAFKGGLINLGGDGQFHMGALAATWVATTFIGIPLVLHIILILLSAAMAGGIWGGIAGFLKAKLGTNEVIMTIMMNFVALYFMSYLVYGPLKEPGAFIPQSKLIASSLRLFPIIPNTRAHFGIVIAIVLAVVAFIFISKTVWGYRINAVGYSPKAANYAGINTKFYTTLILALSGAFAGLAGMVEVFGIHFRLLDGINPSFGFTAIVVALLGRLHPLGIIIASLFMGALTVGANSMQVTMEVPVSIFYIIQSLVILFMLIGFSLKPKLAYPKNGKIISSLLGVKKEGVRDEHHI